MKDFYRIRYELELANGKHYCISPIKNSMYMDSNFAKSEYYNYPTFDSLFDNTCRHYCELWTDLTFFKKKRVIEFKTEFGDNVRIVENKADSLFPAVVTVDYIKLQYTVDEVSKKLTADKFFEYLKEHGIK